MTSQTLESSSSGLFPRAQNSSQLTQAGLCEAREMLGLGTQKLRPWGLKHQQQTMVSSISLPSQSRLEYWGPRRCDYIIPVRLETAFSQPNPQTQTGKAMTDAANITQRAIHFRKLCITAINLGGDFFFIASINQSLYCHLKFQPKQKQFWVWVKCVWKLVICYLSSVKTNDKCEQSARFTIEVIAKFFIWVGRAHFSLTPLLSHH